MKVKQLARTLSGIWFGTAHGRGCDCDRQHHLGEDRGDAAEPGDDVSMSSRSRFICEKVPDGDVLNPS
jgi:hypothetical protein